MRFHSHGIDTRIGADAAGHLLRETYDELPVGQSVSGTRDSSFLVRYHRSSARVDTVARLMRRPVVTIRETNAKGENTFVGQRPLRLRVGEQYVVHPDGWIAIVRINPFRVDWRSPEGRWSTIYYPGVARLENARTITVGAGERREHVDITLPAAKTSTTRLMSGQ